MRFRCKVDSAKGDRTLCAVDRIICSPVEFQLGITRGRGLGGGGGGEGVDDAEAVWLVKIICVYFPDLNGLV